MSGEEQFWQYLIYLPVSTLTGSPNTSSYKYQAFAKVRQSDRYSLPFQAPADVLSQLLDLAAIDHSRPAAQKISCAYPLKCLAFSCDRPKHTIREVPHPKHVLDAPLTGTNYDKSSKSHEVSLQDQ